MKGFSLDEAAWQILAHQTLAFMEAMFQQKTLAALAWIFDRIHLILFIVDRLVKLCRIIPIAAMLSRYGVVSLLAAAAVVVPVQAQIGVTLCACQPSVYTFQLNFSAFCDVSTIDSRPGVRGADCFARGIGLYADDTFDFVPVQVTTISIIELNRDFQVLAQTPYTNNFRDGDKVTYTSMLGTPQGVAELAPESIPGGLQIDIVGINRLEQSVTNVWIILFDNVCGIFPVLKKGDQIGWTIIEDIRKPYQSVCPIAGSDAPTPAPKTPTTSHPSSEPSNAPMEAMLSMDEPTLYPSAEPSEAPFDEAPVCIKGKAGKGKSGKGKSGKGKSGKSGSGKSGSGESYHGKAGTGKSGKGTTYYDGYSPVHATMHDFYRFGVSPLSAGSHPIDPNDKEKDFYGKGYAASKSDPDDDDDDHDNDEECLPPKKKKLTKKASEKKLKKEGKGKSMGKAKSDGGKAGKGKAGKGYDSHDQPRDDDLKYSGKGSGGDVVLTESPNGKGGKGGKSGGKAGGKSGKDSSSGRVVKKLEDRDPARAVEAKLARLTTKVSKPVPQPASKPEPVAVAPSLSPIKAETSAPSLSFGTLNMDLLQSRISHWFQQHGDEPADSGSDRRSLR